MEAGYLGKKTGISLKTEKGARKMNSKVEKK